MKSDTELDDLLEESLEAIEAGLSPELAAARLPEDATELGGLMRLATEVRNTPAPALSAAGESAARKRLAVAAGELASRQNARPARRWAWAFGIGGMVMTAFLCGFAVLAASAGLWLYGPAAAHTATLADVSGPVEIGSANGAIWQPAIAGATIQSGERIRTGAEGSATVAFFEGSRSWIGPGSEVELTRLGGRWGDVLQVELRQESGGARYTIVPFRDPAAQFLVDTPGGSASVHGTIFAVTVDGQGRALFSVDRGSVQVANTEGKTLVTTGQATGAVSGQAPQPAAFRFSANETLSSVDGSTWNLSGLRVQVTGQTAILGKPRAGQTVFVEGRILDQTHWVADAISLSDRKQPARQITGSVQAAGNGGWKIGEASVPANLVTPGIKSGDGVLLTYGADRKPAQIIKLAAEAEVAQSLCSAGNPQPKGQALANRYGTSLDEIMGWFCRGYGFGEIDLAYKLSGQSGAAVADIFAMRQSGLGWGQIEQRLRNTPTPESGTPTLDGSSTPAPEITDTPTPSGAETTTATPGPGLTATPAGTETGGCTGANPQPKGQSLADQYGVSYAEIMGWFCQGYGFGEIDLAYKLSGQSGTSVSDIFAMRQSGMGWGQIEQQLGKDKGQDKGKGKGKGKGKNP